jgi:hypothetical protein
MYFYNNDPNHGPELDHFVNHASPTIVTDVVLNSSAEMLCV